MTQKILLVEDEAKLAQVLMDYLKQYGNYDCHHLDHGDAVMPYLRTNQPDLIILDVMLPGEDGLSLARKIAANKHIPFIMVTARIEEIDRLLGLELGADDYICKPFSPREVVARVKAVLRRTSAGPIDQREFLQIDDKNFTASINGQILKLTPVEFTLLNFLAARPGQVFSRDQLMDRIYHDYRVVSERTIDTHVKNLRKKLTDASEGEEFIESIYGVGYRFLIRGSAG